MNTNLDYKANAALRAQKTSKIINKALVYGFLTLIAIFILIPFYWMLNISLQTTEQVLWSTTPGLFPQPFAPENFVNVFTTAGRTGMTFWNFLANTLIVAFFSTTIGVLFAIIIAFALARLNFKGKNLLFLLLLATMMIPSEMFLITNVQTIFMLGWRRADGIGSFFAMIIPGTVSVFQVFLLRQSFKQIPNELYLAAKVDGCKDFKYLWTVMVPMAKSSIVTILILRIMSSWNSFMWPQMVAHERFRLLTAWLRTSFIDDELGVTAMNLQMAATAAVTIPLLILFIFARKYIMSGISRSGVKG